MHDTRSHAPVAPARFTLLRPTRERVLALTWVLGAVVLWLAADAAASHGLGHDSHAYWIAPLDASAYGGLPGEGDAFLYSPLFAQAAHLVTWLPWPVYLALWTASAVAAYVWLLRPLRWVWAVPLAALAIEDVTLGNTTWLLALLAVAGMRRAAWWVPIAFTKVPAGVGILWHVVRRDWRGVASAVALGAGLLAVSFALSPQMWIAYVELMRGLGSPEVAARTAVAAVMVVLAARSDRPWLVPVALVVCAPLPLAYTWSYLLAVPRLLPESFLARINAPFGGLVPALRRSLDIPARGGPPAAATPALSPAGPASGEG